MSINVFRLGGSVKPGARNDVNNYRLISVLPLVSKIMERDIQVQFLAFLTEHNLLSDFQSGFRKKHSTETAVVYLTDYILEHMDRQMIRRNCKIRCLETSRRLSQFIGAEIYKVVPFLFINYRIYMALDETMKTILLYV